MTSFPTFRSLKFILIWMLLLYPFKSLFLPQQCFTCSFYHSNTIKFVDFTSRSSTRWWTLFLSQSIISIKRQRWWWWWRGWVTNQHYRIDSNLRSRIVTVLLEGVISKVWYLNQDHFHLNSFQVCIGQNPLLLITNCSRSTAEIYWFNSSWPKLCWNSVTVIDLVQIIFIY